MTRDPSTRGSATSEAALSDGLTEDTLLGGRVRLLQPKAGYRAAIDPLAVAAACPAATGHRVLDLGAGAGSISLALAARVQGVKTTGVEIDAGLVRMANASAWLNGMSARVRFMQADILALPQQLRADSFDHVVLNPPFLEAGSATESADPVRHRSNMEGEARLVDWIGIACRMVRHGGSVTLIQRGDRLPDALDAFRRVQPGGVTVYPLWPKAGSADARRVIVRAKRGSGAPFSLLPGLVLHEPGGELTEAAEAILRHAQPMDF